MQCTLPTKTHSPHKNGSSDDLVYIYMNSIYTEEGEKVRSGDEVAEVVVGAVGAAEGCYDTIMGKINR